MPKPMLFSNAREAGGQHDDQQADQTHFRPMHAQRDHQDQRRDALDIQTGALACGTPLRQIGGMGFQHL